MTKFHQAADGSWTRCRAVVQKGQGVTMCPLELDGVVVSHTVGFQGVAAAGGGVVRKALTDGSYRLTTITNNADGKTFTARTGKRKRLFRLDGTLIRFGDRGLVEKELNEEAPRPTFEDLVGVAPERAVQPRKSQPRKRYEIPPQKYEWWEGDAKRSARFAPDLEHALATYGFPVSVSIGDMGMNPLYDNGTTHGVTADGDTRENTSYDLARKIVWYLQQYPTPVREVQLGRVNIEKRKRRMEHMASAHFKLIPVDDVDELLAFEIARAEAQL